MLTTLAPPRMVWRARGLAFGDGVQSIEHDGGARRDPHQIRCCLAKPVVDIRRPLREGASKLERNAAMAASARP